MSQLMEILFSLSDTPMEAEVQAVEAAKEAIRAAEEHLTYEEFENLWNAVTRIYHGSDLDSFTQGFRMGVQMTLEGLRPVGPDQPSWQK